MLPKNKTFNKNKARKPKKEVVIKPAIKIEKGVSFDNHPHNLAFKKTYNPKKVK